MTDDVGADKRSVATDALETLGMHNIPDNSGRDAIHLAVEPVISKTWLSPGQTVSHKDGVAYPSDPHNATEMSPPVGIVDPFLPHDVKPGERFWLVVFPRQITSLRHVWVHPDFDEASTKELLVSLPKEPARMTDEELEAELWLRAYAWGTLEVEYDELMQRAKDFALDGEYWNEGARWESEQIPDKFWDHYETLTGIGNPDPQYGGNFFSCSC